MTRAEYFNLIDGVVNELDGKKIDVDNTGAGSTGDNAQCVDLIKFVIKKITGKVIQYDVVNWKNILNYAREISQDQVDKGDIFLWVGKHTGIGLGKIGEGKGTFEQNSPIGSPCQKKAWRTINAPLKWLRINGTEDSEPVAPAPEPEARPAPVVVAVPPPQIGDRVTTTATVDVQNGKTLILDIINDKQSIFAEINSRGNAVLRAENGVVRCAVPVDSLRRV
jgi:hypothetical protein